MDWLNLLGTIAPSLAQGAAPLAGNAGAAAAAAPTATPALAAAAAPPPAPTPAPATPMTGALGGYDQINANNANPDRPVFGMLGAGPNPTAVDDAAKPKSFGDQILSMFDKVKAKDLRSAAGDVMKQDQVAQAQDQQRMAAARAAGQRPVYGQRPAQQLQMPETVRPVGNMPGQNPVPGTPVARGALAVTDPALAQRAIMMSQLPIRRY